MSEQDQKIPPPGLLSVIICDQVILNAVDKKPTIVGVFENISAESYPARHPRLAFFCELTNGRGTVPIAIRLVDVTQSDKILFERTVQRLFADVRQVHNLTFDISGVIFPHAGEYRFQIYAGGEFLGERRIICRVIKMPPGRPNE
ncbi:MAG: hypothetical protein WC374_08425 [Phycisphaerae bacterium]|jgi:hypothetical protein